MVDFYPEWFRLFISKSDEKGVISKKIANLAQKYSGGSCLEIGPGLDPYSAIILARYFSSYTIIEKRKTEARMPAGVRLVHDNFETHKFKQIFDFIIASHVFYYFKDIDIAFDKMVGLLMPEQ